MERLGLRHARMNSSPLASQVELRLFLEVCKDKNALLLTGDTCQTIARGVGFRFEELKTMFFNAKIAQAFVALAVALVCTSESCCWLQRTDL